MIQDKAWVSTKQQRHWGLSNFWAHWRMVSQTKCDSIKVFLPDYSAWCESTVFEKSVWIKLMCIVQLEKDFPGLFRKFLHSQSQGSIKFRNRMHIDASSQWLAKIKPKVFAGQTGCFYCSRNFHMQLKVKSEGHWCNFEGKCAILNLITY